MRRKGKILFFLIAAFFVVLALWIGISGSLAPNSVLVLDLGAQIEDQRPQGLLVQLTGPSVTRTDEITSAIDTARTDWRIAGLVVHIPSFNAGWAKAEEVRARLAEFQSSGKPLICLLDGELPRNREYFVASACGEVWLLPTSTLGVAGMMSASTFYRGTLDKLKIEPNFYGLEEYKTYRNQFMEKKYTAAHREAVESLVNSIYARYVEETAKARKLDSAQFAALLRDGPYLASEALEKKLVDRLAYWDEVEDYFTEKTGDWSPVELSRYLYEVPNTGAETIAVVYATGAIETGHSRFDDWDGFIMGSDTVAENLRTAREDDDVKAIILRVDSPGGSALASEIIRREVLQARESKPVVVSMSDVAASGGYWIAMSANRIVAAHTTVTGSIGVVYGKMNVSGLYSLLGLSTDHYATNPNATILWEQQNFTPEQEKVVLRFMQDIYANFTQGVAEGRKLKIEEVQKIAKGRVWSGVQGRERGLVDEYGGMDRAVAAARDLAGIGADAKVRLLRLPEERTFLQQLLSGEIYQPKFDASLRGRLRRLTSQRDAMQARMPFSLDIR